MATSVFDHVEVKHHDTDPEEESISMRPSACEDVVSSGQAPPRQGWASPTNDVVKYTPQQASPSVENPNQRAEWYHFLQTRTARQLAATIQNKNASSMQELWDLNPGTVDVGPVEWSAQPTRGDEAIALPQSVDDTPPKSDDIPSSAATRRELTLVSCRHQTQALEGVMEGGFRWGAGTESTGFSRKGGSRWQCGGAQGDTKIDNDGVVREEGRTGRHARRGERQEAGRS
eukprot:2578363-Rhodomonas_salina.1